MKIKVLVIDDEPLAQEVIKTYLNDLNNIEVISYCSDALEAMQIMKEQTVDLIFLDINMPKLSGIEWIKTLQNPPLIVLTTAYTQYAMEGYELNVLDYLAKPFSLSRFLKSVQKAEEKLKSKRSRQIETKETFFIKSNKKTYQLKFDEIIYIEGLGDYIKIYTDKSHFVTNTSMKKMEEELPSATFFRVHKSFIVNLKKITSIEGNMIDVGLNRITIGNNFRQEFFDKISKSII